MTTVHQLIPYEPGQRLICVGSSGTGKSWGVGTVLQAQAQRILILDPKRTDSLNRWNWPVTEHLEGVEVLGQQGPGARMVWRPAWNTTPQQLFTQVEILCQWAFQTGDMIVYLDEIKQVCPTPQQCPPSLRGLAILGRERRVGFWGSAQRPVGVPVELMSEANHYIIHALNRKQDRARIAEVMESDIENDVKQLEERQFMYMNPRKKIYSGPHWFE